MADAQVIGTYRWQLQPYCNVVTVTVTQVGGSFTLDGSDDQCGSPALRSGTVGMAFFNPDGTIGIGLTTIVPPSATAIHTDAAISLATVSGTWRDSAGNAGAFVFTPGAAEPGGKRPVPAGGLAPSTVITSTLASGAVTTQKLANGSVTGAKIAIDAVHQSEQIAANTIELSDLNQIGVSNVSVTLALSAHECATRESNTYAGAVEAGDLLLATPVTVSAGVYTVPLIAGVDGRFGYMLCNATNSAITTSTMALGLARVPK